MELGLLADNFVLGLWAFVIILLIKTIFVATELYCIFVCTPSESTLRKLEYLVFGIYNNYKSSNITIIVVSTP